jgi:7-cyano-7-deazaguanine synthase in queuosine biosynthesis
MILVHLSGGIDSTGMLIKLLKETDKKIVAHYCKIGNNKQQLQQLKAAQYIVKYCKEHYRDFEFVVTEMTFPSLSGVIHTLFLFSTAGLILAQQNKEITAVARGFSTLYDQARPGARKVLKSLYEHGTDRKIVQLFPLEGLEKHEVLKIIPEELRSYTWVCTKPLKNIPCATCPSCLERQKAEKKLIDLSKIII